MRVALLVITDGRREDFDASMTSLSRMWRGPEPEVTVVDDSGDPDFRGWLDHRTRKWPATVVHHERRRGFAGAIASGWDQVHEADYVFHAEADFVYERPVDVPLMARLLDLRPYLAQVSLARQAVNEAEAAAGGLLEWLAAGQLVDEQRLDDLRWLEQRVYWTTNPSLYRRPICYLGWPQEAESEGLFTHRLLTQGFGVVEPDAVRFAIMGGLADPPAVTHIGVRQGTGY